MSVLLLHILSVFFTSLKEAIHLSLLFSGLL